METKLKTPAEAWAEYHEAILKYGLDNITHDAWHQGENKNLSYLYDGFFAGFFAARRIYFSELRQAIDEVEQRREDGLNNSACDGLENTVREILKTQDG